MVTLKIRLNINEECVFFFFQVMYRMVSWAWVLCQGESRISDRVWLRLYNMLKHWTARGIFSLFVTWFVKIFSGLQDVYLLLFSRCWQDVYVVFINLMSCYLFPTKCTWQINWNHWHTHTVTTSILLIYSTDKFTLYMFLKGPPPDIQQLHFLYNKYFDPYLHSR